MNARDERALHAYHDGELGGLSRRRFERRLARSPELRHELAALRWMGELIREADAQVPTPDLWASIARRLPARSGTRGRSLSSAGLLRPAGALVAAAAAVAAAVLVWPTSAPEGAGGAIRWIDAGEHSVMVLKDDAEATIIWLLDPASEGAQRRVGRRSV